MVNTTIKQAAKRWGVLLVNDSGIRGGLEKALLEEQHIFQTEVVCGAVSFPSHPMVSPGMLSDPALLRCQSALLVA